MVVIAKTAVVVPQQNAFIVERVGRYHATLQAGFHVLFPFIDAIRYKHSLKEVAIDIPARWQSRDIFLSFEGVDDLYELYVNGALAGQGGDLATRKDAFSEKKSHNITRLVKAGGNATIAVRVHDWGGAGGIFRPVTLGTAGANPALTLLK